MSTVALTSSRHQTLATQRPHPLLSVLVWELRRFRASRLLWVQALAFFGLVLFVTWFGHHEVGVENPNLITFSGLVSGTSAWGFLAKHLGYVALIGVLLPFVNVDGVTRDLSRRTHELLMATPLPTWAYVWGRYLMGLLISLGLALLLLVAIWGMGVVLHLTGTDYPAPDLGNLLILWGSMVIPATVLVSSLSFALGTVLPRQATLIKVILLLGWLVGAIILPLGFGTTVPPAWYSNWDPTSATTAQGLIPQYSTNFFNQSASATSVAQLQHLLVTIENTMPDISSWLAPHLIEALLSLLLVVLAAITFRRFRSA